WSKFEGLIEVVIPPKDRVLDSTKYLVILFKENVSPKGYFSGGIWIGWKDTTHLVVIQNHPQFIVEKVYCGDPMKSVLIAFVYGSPNRMKRKALLETLKEAVPFDLTPWMLVGDFNTILSESDKKVTVLYGDTVFILVNFFESKDLHDLGCRGPSFSW
ncbi:hypothetical protein Gotur_002273, partial [Gossypium turneri]